MRTFLIRRLLAAIPLIIFVTFLTKAMLVLSPGNYLDQLRLTPGISRRYVEEQISKYHLDSRNVFERYWHWAVPAVKGDFGDSLLYKRPVWDMLGERVLNTL